jgi:hypothetical protein
VGNVTFYSTGDYLQFDSFDDFINTANYLNNSGVDHQGEFFGDLGYQTQAMILQRICVAEDVFDSEYYKGIDEDLSVNELNELGLGIEYSPLFKYYLEQGFISVLSEEDGSESYSPNVLNPALMSVLPEEGIVIVDDNAMQYTANSIKIAPISSLRTIDDLKESTRTNLKNGVSVIEFNSKYKSAGHVTNIDEKITKYKGSKLRVSSRYALWDGTTHGQPFTHDPATHIYINHIIELKAEEKRWGKWKIRNNYKPLCGLESAWQTCMKFGSSTICSYTQSGAGIKQSPFNEDPFTQGCTNYYQFSPVPVGWVSYNGEYYDGIVGGSWSLEVNAANIDDPDNFGSHN